MSKRQATKVAVRVDASANWGTGHLKRCMSLASALAEAGAQVLFVCRAVDAVAANTLQGHAWAVHWLDQGLHAPPSSSPTNPPRLSDARQGVELNQDARKTAEALTEWAPDWVVVDHYELDASWHLAVRTALACRVLVIDDLADRPIDADVLINHNWDPGHKTKYADRVQRPPTWLTGPRFALISPAYRHIKRQTRHDRVRSIGIFLGGTDPGGHTAKVLQACRLAGFDGPIEIASTSVNPHLKTLEQACSADSNVTLTLDQPDLVSFFERHDLHIGAGGGATWERCCAGVPTIGVVLAANQMATLPGLASLGAVLLARLDEETQPQDLLTLTAALKQLLPDNVRRDALSRRAAELVDGRGAQRVALSILGDRLCLRPARLEDMRLLHDWRNHASVRAASTDASSIAFKDHERWFCSALEDPKRLMYVGQVGGLPVGSIRFDRTSDHHFEVSLYVDPDLHGLGLGKHLLCEGERLLSIMQSGGQGFNVKATVKPDNLTSRRLFGTGGYSGGPTEYSKHVCAASMDSKVPS